MKTLNYILLSSILMSSLLCSCSEKKKEISYEEAKVMIDDVINNYEDKYNNIEDIKLDCLKFNKEYKVELNKDNNIYYYKNNFINKEYYYFLDKEEVYDIDLINKTYRNYLYSYQDKWDEVNDNVSYLIKEIKKIIASELEVTKELFKNEELYSFYQVGKNGIEVCSKDSTYKIRFDDCLLTYLNNDNETLSISYESNLKKPNLKDYEIDKYLELDAKDAYLLSLKYKQKNDEKVIFDCDLSYYETTNYFEYISKEEDINEIIFKYDYDNKISYYEDKKNNIFRYHYEKDDLVYLVVSEGYYFIGNKGLNEYPFKANPYRKVLSPFEIEVSQYVILYEEKNQALLDYKFYSENYENFYYEYNSEFKISQPYYHHRSNKKIEFKDGLIYKGKSLTYAIKDDINIFNDLSFEYNYDNVDLEYPNLENYTKIEKLNDFMKYFN